MAISDIPIFSMLRTRMQWHQQRQQVLAENVANADTPNFRPQDLGRAEIRARRRPAPAPLQLARTDPGHLARLRRRGELSRATTISTRSGRPATRSTSRTR